MGYVGPIRSNVGLERSFCSLSEVSLYQYEAPGSNGRVYKLVAPLKWLLSGQSSSSAACVGPEISVGAPIRDGVRSKSSFFEAFEGLCSLIWTLRFQWATQK